MVNPHLRLRLAGWPWWLDGCGKGRNEIGGTKDEAGEDTEEKTEKNDVGWLLCSTRR